MADIFGTAAGAVTGVGMGLLNNYFGQMREEAARRENYKYNEMAAQNADKRTRALYNDIYSPEALKQQYMKAGLSPSLMFGGTPGQGGTAGAQGAGVSQGSTYMPISMLEGAQIGLMTAQAENIKADTKKKKEETTTIKETRNATIDNIIAQTGNYKAAAALQNAQTTYQDIRNNIENATTSTQIKQYQAELNKTLNEAEEALWKGKNEQYLNKLNEATYNEQVRKWKLENDNLAKDLLVKDAQINLNKAQAAKFNKEIDLITQQINESVERIKQQWQSLELQEKSIENQKDWWDKQYELEGQKIHNEWERIVRSLDIEDKKIEASLIQSADRMTETILTCEKVTTVSIVNQAAERARKRVK